MEAKCEIHKTYDINISLGDADIIKLGHFIKDVEEHELTCAGDDVFAFIKNIHKKIVAY